MWNDTAITRRLGIRYPIVQGPFGGGLSSARLVAAVSNAGGLGSFGAQGMTPNRIREVVREIRALTASPFAVNLWVSTEDVGASGTTRSTYEAALVPLAPFFSELRVPPPTFPLRGWATFDEQVSALLDARPPVFSFVFGVPPMPVIDECRRRSIVTIGAATTVDEAVALEESGVDVVVASGFEAGGHRPSFLRSPETSLTGLFSLLPQVCDAVDIPVIAAGGIADGRGVAAALALGAEGVQIGTAFLACEESNAPPAHREALLGSRAVQHGSDAGFLGSSRQGSAQHLGRRARKPIGVIAAVSAAKPTGRGTSRRGDSARPHRPDFALERAVQTSPPPPAGEGAVSGPCRWYRTHAQPTGASRRRVARATPQSAEL